MQQNERHLIMKFPLFKTIFMSEIVETYFQDIDQTFSEDSVSLFVIWVQRSEG